MEARYCAAAAPTAAATATAMRMSSLLSFKPLRSPLRGWLRLKRLVGLKAPRT
jgi:hypothetical protein